MVCLSIKKEKLRYFNVRLDPNFKLHFKVYYFGGKSDVRGKTVPGLDRTRYKTVFVQFTLNFYHSPNAIFSSLVLYENLRPSLSVSYKYSGFPSDFTL